MNCKTAMELIDPYRESHLSAADEAQLLNHLGECRTCREALVDLDTLDTQLRTLFDAKTADDGFTKRVMSSLPDTSLDRTQAPPARLLVFVRPALAACLALAVAFWFAFHDRAPRLENTGTSAADVARFEPATETTHALGTPFVIARSGIDEYRGATRIHVARVVRGAPELIVDAFPE